MTRQVGVFFLVPNNVFFLQQQILTPILFIEETIIRDSCFTDEDTDSDGNISNG